jgi:hypothetical protein
MIYLSWSHILEPTADLNSSRFHHKCRLVSSKEGPSSFRFRQRLISGAGNFGAAV